MTQDALRDDYAFNSTVLNSARQDHLQQFHVVGIIEDHVRMRGGWVQQPPSFISVSPWPSM